ncbi:hypothetical protein [Alicyclobacillus fastidiosus]
MVGDIPYSPTDQTVKDYVSQWLEEKSSSIEFGTYRKYEWLVRCHIIPHIGHIRLSKLMPQQLQSFYTNLLSMDDPLGKRSVLHIHNLLHQALDRAVKWNLVGRNVADAVEPPKPDFHEMSLWSEEDISAFLEEAVKKRYYLFYHRHRHGNAKIRDRRDSLTGCRFKTRTT